MIKISKAKKHNTYDLSGEYGVGYTQKGYEFYFDLEDYDLIKDYCWRVGTHGYIECHRNKSVVSMHRLILNVTDRKLQVDHIYHHKNDNRKSQLRIVTNRQNSRNQSLGKRLS